MLTIQLLVNFLRLSYLEMNIVWFLASPNGCIKFWLSVYSRWCFTDSSWSRVFGNRWTTAIQRIFIYQSQLHSSTMRFIWASDYEKIAQKYCYSIVSNKCAEIINRCNFTRFVFPNLPQYVGIELPFYLFLRWFGKDRTII